MMTQKTKPTILFQLDIATKAALLMVVILLGMAPLNTRAEITPASENESLGLPGDNLDLYATLDLFQNSKTIEEFEAALNKEETGINNLDLNADGEVDFIKVTTQQEDDDFAFVLQVDVLENETQDVAVILVTKDSEEKVDIQLVGDEELYGKDYVIEPKPETPAVTANPAYSGPDTVVVESQPATVVVLESEPIVRYIYSPVYVPYIPPYYYGYYPPYYRPYPVVSFHIYFGRTRHYHNRYYGGHRGGNTVIINNNRTYNNYSVNKKTSNTVVRNKNEGNYKRDQSPNKAPQKIDKPNKPNNPTPQAQPNQKPNVNKDNLKENKPNTQAKKPNSKPSSKPANKPNKAPANRAKPKGGRR
ncbi:hypothetical protein KFE98_01710 [bacterium SCSIO 12741]|nr:hypothetical protein KFE98_01710 [bacterium SCSIO 12741]